MKMMLKRLLVLLVIISISIVVAFVVLDRKYDGRFALYAQSNSENEEKHLLWDEGNNLIQTGNTCGTHSVMALLLSAKNIKEDPYEIYNAIQEKLKNGYIWPWGLTRYLREKGIDTKIYILNIMSNKQKEKWIKNKIDANKPVIIVVGNNKYLHYITILGYNMNGFTIYDSSVRANTNGIEPGNITIPVNEVLLKMNSAEMYRIRMQIAITNKN